MGRNHDDSSSSDEEVLQYRSNIHLPNINLATYRNQQNKKTLTKANLSNAGKKITGQKSVRFPDLYEPKQSMISTSSTNNSSDSDFSIEKDEINPELPSFSMGGNNVQGNFEELDNGEDVSDVELEVHQDGYSSSDVDIDDQQDPNSIPMKRILTSSSRNNETDITDQKKSDSISTNSYEVNEKPGGFKGLLRKMTLADQSYSVDPNSFNKEEEGKSDTFLGRVFDLNDISIGNSIKKEDEESTVGFDDRASKSSKNSKNSKTSNTSELKRMDFNNLSQEAKNLILAHAPGGASNLMMLSGIPEGHEDDDKFLDQAAESSPMHLDDPETDDPPPGFYAPNPDYTSNNLLSHEQDQFLLDNDDDDDGYVAPPKNLHAGVLSSLLKLYQQPQESKSSTSVGGSTLTGNLLSETQSEYDQTLASSHNFSDLKKIKSGFKSGLKGSKKMADKITGKKREDKQDPNQNFTDEESLVEEEYPGEVKSSGMPSFQNARPKVPKKATNVKADPTNLAKKLKKKKRLAEEQLRITVHISDVLQRQRFIIRMCKALMLFGAPTHRLEEYMVMTSRVLEIDGQFLYFPGCMIVAFGDAATRTSEVHLVKCAQGVNLSKLSDTHKIYKGVVHDLIGVEEAASKLEDLLKQKNLYPPWMCVFIYGFGSAMVCTFAFSGYWYDIPIAFGVGLCVGYLQYYVSSMSALYSSVFEVTASIVVSFIARAIGSVHRGEIFCFAAIAQGALAIILPGYIILCGSLELQSRNLVAGSVRMFYAIIYSLFLGFGIMLGSALYGWIDKNSVSTTTCTRHIDDRFRIIFVPAFSICLALINQARLTQLPAMVVIAATGYVATYFAGKHFSTVTEFTACIGSFIVGILGNLYSRIWKGMAVSAMLPAIFVQVPSGIASQSTLLSGIQSADQITKSNSTKTTTVTSASSLSFGATMVEVSIGISVGLFASALVVYPFGKKRTGLFSL